MIKILSYNEIHENNFPSIKEGQERQESVKFKLKKDFKRIKELKLHVSAKVDIDVLIKQNPPPFKYYRDHFLYILHLITYIPARLKKYDLNANKGYTPINATILQKRNHEYEDYIKYLIKHEVIERNYYTIGKSYGYRYTEKYVGIIKAVTISKWTLIKSIVYMHKQDDSKATEQLGFLKNWFNNKLDIDIEEATNYLIKQYKKDVKDRNIKYPQKKLNMRLTTAFSINDKNFTFGVDSTSGRLHTRLTQLKSELRKYVTYDGQKLCNIDIVNSQPYLLRALLNEEIYSENKMEERMLKYNDKYKEFSKNTNLTNTTELTYTTTTTNSYNPSMIVKMIRNNSQEEDVKLFIKLVTNGSFYEEFGQVLKQQAGATIPDNEALRKYAKACTFSALFSPNQAIGYKQEVKDFKKNFPNVYKILAGIKKGRKQHPTLACMLQSLEAELILWKACVRINDEYPHIPLFTIHDSITTTVENADLVETILGEELEKALIEKPKIKREIWE